MATLAPRSNLETPDVWPNMLALYALRTHFEATGDKRIIPFMLRYFRWQANLPVEKVLLGSWQKVRGGDNLDVIIYWLYNQTGERQERYGGTDRWPGFEVFPTTPWNYGLMENPTRSFEVVRSGREAS